MNDLDLIRELGSETPLLSLPELSGARERVVKGTGRDRRGPARWLAMAAVCAGAAAAIAAGVFAGAPAPHHRAPHAIRPETVVNAHLTAKEVLDRAAAAALRQATVVPRPDQFVFTQVNVGTGVVVRTWLSVDGKRNGLETQTGSDGKTSSTAILGCVNGFHKIRTPGVDGKPIRGGGKPVPMKSTTPMDGPVITEPCTPAPAYFPDMPTSASAMSGYLEQAQGISLANLNDLAKTVGSMLQSDYFLPAQRAALYEFLATTPGLSVEHNVQDITGRPGVGVGWSLQGSRAMNIFDPASYAYLGMTTWGEQDQRGGDALLQTAVVDYPGQLP
jgi:hypothetical protein